MLGPPVRWLDVLRHDGPSEGGEPLEPRPDRTPLEDGASDDFETKLLKFIYGDLAPMQVRHGLRMDLFRRGK